AVTRAVIRFACGWCAVRRGIHPSHLASWISPRRACSRAVGRLSAAGARTQAAGFGESCRRSANGDATRRRAFGGGPVTVRGVSTRPTDGHRQSDDGEPEERALGHNRISSLLQKQGMVASLVWTQAGSKQFATVTTN